MKHRGKGWWRPNFQVSEENKEAGDKTQKDYDFLSAPNLSEEAAQQTAALFSKGYTCP